MTLKPNQIFHINTPPTGTGFDLIARVIDGCYRAKAAGFDLCFIVENDDFYPSDYFKKYEPYFEQGDFFGQDYSDYYNLRNLTHNRFQHQYRASLFTTGFKLSALNNFEWPDNRKPFLDIPLWQYARHKRRIFVDSGAVGIKHNLGLCGGKGHQMYWPKNYDHGMNWLKKSVDQEAFTFYHSLAEKFNQKAA